MKSGMVRRVHWGFPGKASFMASISLFAGAVIVGIALVVLARLFVGVYLKYRGDRIITCPENQRPAGVRVDAGHALFTAAGREPVLRLESCSRWPERRDCGQECLQQVEASPEDCLVRTILTDWYEGKNCALCGKPIGEIHWADRKPALLDRRHQTIEWRDIAPEAVPDALASDQPVCWNCHVVNRMVTQHPDLVINRERPI